MAEPDFQFLEAGTEWRIPWELSAEGGI